jgi:hypothetical protein
VIGDLPRRCLSGSREVDSVSSERSCRYAADGRRPLFGSCVKRGTRRRHTPAAFRTGGAASGGLTFTPLARRRSSRLSCARVWLPRGSPAPRSCPHRPPQLPRFRGGKPAVPCFRSGDHGPRPPVPSACDSAAAAAGHSCGHWVCSLTARGIAPSSISRCGRAYRRFHPVANCMP